MVKRNGGTGRVLSAALAAVLACSLVPAPAFAQAADGAAGRAPQAEFALFGAVQRAVRVHAIDARPDAYEPAEIIVTYRDGAPAAAAEGQGAAAGQELDGPLDTIAGARGELVSDGGVDGDAPTMALVEVPDGLSVGEAVAAAEDDPDVAHAQPNYRYRPLGQPGLAATAAADAVARAVSVNDEYAQSSVNDKTQKNQWWLSAVRAPDAWEYARCEGAVTVAVLDTGINFEHEDLKDNIDTTYAWDAVTGTHLTDSVKQNALAHGCHVAGIVAGKANNEKGVAGVSYDAKVLPIAVFTVSGNTAGCDDATLIKAYNYLMSDPNPGDNENKSVIERTNLHVVNMSLGGYAGMDESFEAMIAQAERKGVLTVAAGGNGDDNGEPLTQNSYPSDYDEVMSVVALQGMTERTHWSDYNDCKDIAAPGADIWSTWYSGTDAYYCTSGTSMATPVVAGCAALLWKYDPALTVAQVKEALYSTAVDLGEPGRDDYYGWGRIDVAAAIESLGTAHITAERQTMGRTGTQKLTASDVREPSKDHTWNWSVDSQYSAVASIDAEGVLTAKAAGSVVVDVAATDDANVKGHIGITITEITVPGSVDIVSDGVKHRVTLAWSAADAAVKYSIQRADAKDGTYQPIATVAAEAGKKMYGYTDADVEAGKNYYYRIEPVGQLEGAAVSGQQTSPVRGYFSDKAALSAHIDTAQALVDDAVVSTDGSDIDASVQWTTAANRDALADQVARAEKVLAAQYARQAVVDSVASDLQQAIGSYRSALRPGAKGTARPEQPATQTNPTGNAGSGTGTGAGGTGASRPATKAENTLKVKAKSPKVKYSKKARKVKASAAYSISGAQGALTFAKSGKSKLKVNKQTGAITVPKKLKKGTYKIKVLVTAAGNDGYKPVTLKVTVKVKVK